MGIDKFNDACRASVMKYADEWRDYVTRQARWVDFDNDYKTLNVEYMESVLWAFKQLHEKGLTYNGYRVLPYCWKDETPLSNHELRMDDDVYKNRQDPAVTVGLRLETGELRRSPGPPRPGRCPPTSARSGLPSTTPSSSRTSPARRERYVIGAAPPGAPTPRTSATTSTRHRRGRIVHPHRRRAGGLSYTPLFTDYAGHENAHRVFLADYVTTTDGTGIVHQAPAYGEDDQKVCEEAGIPVVPVGARLPLSPGPSRHRGPAGLRRQQAHHRPPQGEHPRRGRHRVGALRHGAGAPPATSTATRTAGAAATR